jgi:hypothetical protein
MAPRLSNLTPIELPTIFQSMAKPQKQEIKPKKKPVKKRPSKKPPAKPSGVSGL